MAPSQRGYLYLPQPVLLAAVALVLIVLVLGPGGPGPLWVRGDELWERDVSDEMGIGLADSGYRRVFLRCSADNMNVELELEDDFDGVIYTRGAFYERTEPCFIDATGGHNFTMRIPLDKCNTRNKNGLYINTVVVQYDDELIMPGDAAFKLECDFSEPKDFTVNADLTDRSPVQSRITLEDADPAVKEQREQKSSVSSSTDTVTFTPENVDKTLVKDEL